MVKRIDNVPTSSFSFPRQDDYDAARLASEVLFQQDMSTIRATYGLLVTAAQFPAYNQSFKTAVAARQARDKANFDLYANAGTL